MEGPIEEMEIESDNEGSDITDVVGAANEEPVFKPYLFVNTHELEDEGYKILDVLEDEFVIIDVPHLHENDRYLYSNGYWSLLLRQEEEHQSLMLLNLELSRMLRLHIFEMVEGERVYAHNIRTGTFTGNVGADYMVFLIENPPNQQGLIIWISSSVPFFNDEDVFDHENDNVNYLHSWHRRIIEVQPPALDAFSMIYWEDILFWIIRTEEGREVRSHDRETGLNIRYIISPQLLFFNDDHFYGPRQFLIVQGDVILFLCAPAIEVEGVLQPHLRFGILEYLEDNIGYVRRIEPLVYIHGGAAFFNRGQGGLFAANPRFLVDDIHNKALIGPVPRDCSMYGIDVVSCDVLATCQNLFCEGLWFLSDHGNFCINQWHFSQVAMLVDNENQGLIQDNEEGVDFEDDDNSSDVTEGSVQEGYKSKRGFMVSGVCKMFGLLKLPSTAREGILEGLDVIFVFNYSKTYCCGVKLELTAANSVPLWCATLHLEMLEELCEGNLISQTEAYLKLPNWNDSLKALQSCVKTLPYSEGLGIVERCISSLAVKACTDLNLFRWHIEFGGPMQSPWGSVVWNRISTKVCPRNFCPDWWCNDVTSLKFSMYRRLIQAMESREIRQEIIAGSLSHYVKKYLQGLTRHQAAGSIALRVQLLEDEQKNLLEEMHGLLPVQKDLVPTKNFFKMLHIAMILKADAACTCYLEERFGLQFDQPSSEDLLLPKPNFSYTMDTLYNVECVQRMLEHSLQIDQLENNGMASPGLMDDMLGSPSLTPLMTVARLIDEYLAENALDINWKLPKFQDLTSMVPDYARPVDDMLYRAIDIYLKAHLWMWMSEGEREQLCQLTDCQKLPLESCTHTAQNECLALRDVVQVLFEQLQLRTSITGRLLISDNLDRSHPLSSGTIPVSGEAGGWATTVRENQALKVRVGDMRMRLKEVEKECSNMMQVIEKLGKKGKVVTGWGNVGKKIGLKLG